MIKKNHKQKKKYESKVKEKKKKGYLMFVAIKLGLYFHKF